MVGAIEPLWSGFSGIVIGIGLSAACGFRVILPFLGLSIAAMNGYVNLAPEFQWIGTWPALIAFATAAALEIGAYYIPWMDNLLDAVTTPLAVAAGTIAAASVMSDVSPFMKWSIALIAGGGMAGAVQTGTALLRGMSTVSTGGMANVVISTIELAGAVIATTLSLLMPIVAFTAAIIIAIWVIWKLLHRPARAP
ncbi:MAG: DUF4126 domain-containing protein [Syntrophales bacterium]|jgi:hypothetical protein|nr:DUF4126 domain-containing protein [Syntrophales bacterium]